MAEFFRKNLTRGVFFSEISSRSYAETQGGFSCLAEEINNRICFEFSVEIKYDRLIGNVMVTLNYIGNFTRIFCFAFLHNNFPSDISRIEDVLLAFACGLGYNC